MTTGIFVQTPDEFTDPDLPILRYDPAIEDSTLWCIDLLDPLSWPTQGAGADADEIVNLIDLDAGAPCIVEGALAWSNGLVIDPGSATEHIKLPASSKLASDAAGFGFTLWAKFSSFTTNRGLAGIGKPPSGSGTFAHQQWGIYVDSAGAIKALCNGGTGFGGTAISTGVVHQIGLTMELAGGSYNCRLWIDGQQVGQSTIAGPLVTTTIATEAWIGLIDTVLAGQTLTVYRSMGDSLTGRAGDDFIADDYAAGSGRGFA